MKPHRVELTLSPVEAADSDGVKLRAASKLRLSPEEICVVPVRRSIDARKGQPKVVLLLDVYPGQPPVSPPAVMSNVPDLKKGTVLIVGAGPAGYFCALELLLLGVRPIILERGKDTKARRYDLRAIMQADIVDPNSNYCFGEGGAGTYSDGKLYTRSGKRGSIAKVLQILVDHGAKRSILVDTHPHIGSNKLPIVVENLRATIESHGGEIHFQQQVTDLWMNDGDLHGAVVRGGEKFHGDAVVLATGHSARDIYHLLHQRGLQLEQKTYALGVRVEHPQPVIDEIQYRQNPRDPYLPAASYRLAHLGVYSFCMCPGGLMVPAATAPGEIVVNGMSMAKRNSRWANSGIVTAVEDSDLAPYLAEHGPLAGLALQSEIERAAFKANGEGSQKAPCQRLGDFLEGRTSTSLPRVSYVPGVVSTDLRTILPPRIAEVLSEGFRHFTSSLKGFDSDEAVLVGVESRTSSPVRIPRDSESLSHPDLFNLYPCGEGAGYAGGIVSAAMDGQRVANAVALVVRDKPGPRGKSLKSG